MEYQDVMKHRWAMIVFFCVCSQYAGFCFLGPIKLTFTPSIGSAFFSAVMGYLTARSVLDPGCLNSLYKAACFVLQGIVSLLINNLALALLWIPLLKSGVKFYGLLTDIDLLQKSSNWGRTVFGLSALGFTGIVMHNTVFRDMIHFCTSTPQGLEDVSSYPALFAHLIGTGLWDVEDLKKLAGLNFLRVMEEAERVRDAMLNEGIPPYEDDAPRQQINNCTSPHLF